MQPAQIIINIAATGILLALTAGLLHIKSVLKRM